MSRDTVVLLHGIMRTKRCMAALARDLEKAGFHALNLDYPSTRYRLQELVEYLHTQISAHTGVARTKIHFVGYSMGGLLIRAYLTKYRPDHLGRVVLIGPPNRGSEVADFVKDWWLYRRLYGPAGQQLITDQTAFLPMLGKADYDVGIIAGNRSLDFISSLIIGKPNDGKVAVENTRLDEAHHHIVLPVTHTFMVQNKAVREHTIRFLRHGNFVSPA